MQQPVESAQSLTLLPKDSKIHVSIEPDITIMSDKKCSTEITSRLLILFAFLEFSLLIPYKIEYCDHLKKYIVETSNWKKFLIYALQTSITIYHCNEIFWMAAADNSIKTIIRCIITSSLLCWTNVILFVLWKKRNSFAKMLTRVGTISLKLEKRGATLRNWKFSTGIVILICVCCIFVSFLEISLFAFKLHKNGRHSKLWLVLEEQGGQLDRILPTFEFTLLRKLLIRTYGLFHSMINRVYFFTIGHFGYAVLFIFSIIVRELYRALKSTIPKQLASLEEFDEVIDLYTTLRRLTTDVNRALGVMMAWGILCHLPYNAYKVNDMLYGSIYFQVSYAVHLSLYLAVLYAAAGVHSEITTILDRLACEKLVLGSSSLQTRVGLLLQQSKMAGIHGAGFFLITYGFLGNIIGVIITYAILIVQSSHK